MRSLKIAIIDINKTRSTKLQSTVDIAALTIFSFSKLEMLCFVSLYFALLLTATRPESIAPVSLHCFYYDSAKFNSILRNLGY